MARLILFALMLIGLAMAVSTIILALRSLAPDRPRPKGDTMPKTFSTVAYVLLIVLMFGVVTGWLGAA